MNVLCFLSGNILSGKEFVALDVIKGWKDNGHNIEVAFVGWHNGKFQQKLNELGIVNHPIKLGWYYLSKISWTLDSLIHYPVALLQFLKIQSNFSPDIIYVDSYRQVILLMPFLKKKVFFHIHDPHTSSSTEKKMINLAAKKVNKFIAVSNFIKQDLVKAGIDTNNIVVVHNGTHIPNDFKKVYLPAGVIRIGIVGQIISRKGHEDVLAACQMLKGKIPFEILIFGTGEDSYIQELKDLSQNYGLTKYIIWKGFESDKAKIFNAIDVIIAATRNDEPFALVALEAGAYKVPIIATQSGGFPESIINGKTGFIVAKNNPAEIADNISHLYNNQNELSIMGDNARQNIEMNFSLQKMQDEIQRLITS